ncbi:hypothetical protein GGU10DRAFT_189158 [Lentinula aff. detonsa]|uniref:Uncharacterized protein n=1 Tax=Lentinula aff. detonsa TaxID=2804958 RepID=A0AA38NSB0_9AGAR|nr:hypothetical protein GGU10DRAFT_189158 [Lentinula aff. detonsa]
MAQSSVQLLSLDVNRSVPATLFVVLQLSGFIGTLSTLFIAYFSPIIRQATWYNFIAFWTLYCLWFLLLFFSGHYRDSEPSLKLCMCQSALIHCASPAASAGTLALVLQLYFSVHSAVSRKVIRYQRLWLYSAFALPYAVTISLMIAVLLMSRAPGTIFIVTQYCSVNQLIPGRLAAGFTVVFIIPTLFLNVLIYVRLRKHWSEFRSSRLRNATSMIIRATAFSICGIFAFLVGIIFFTIVFAKQPGETAQDEVARLNKEYEVLNVILGFFPVFVVIIFGTQGDIIRRLLFWKDQIPSSWTHDYPVPDISLLSISHTGQGEARPGLSLERISSRIDHSESSEAHADGDITHESHSKSNRTLEVFEATATHDSSEHHYP